MAIIGLRWDECECSDSHGKAVDLQSINMYFGTQYLRDELKRSGTHFLRLLQSEVESALTAIHRDEVVDNPYHVWNGRPDKIERDATKWGVCYTVLPTSAANDGVYGEVIEWLQAEGWPILGEVEFLDEVDHPTAKNSRWQSKKYPPNTIRFRLLNSDVKKAFESDFKYLLGELNLNM